MKYLNRHSAAAFVAAFCFGFAGPARGSDIGFEVGNGQFFGTGGALSWFPSALNGLYGKYYEKNSGGSKTRLRMKTFKDVRYDAFKELRRVLEPRGWETIEAEGGFDAMEREGFGHGEGRCAFEIRFLNSSRSLVSADYEAIPSCTLDQAVKAVQDSLQSLNWIE